MEDRFDVTHDGQSVGSVEVKREGLYCRVTCRCRMVGQGVQRLYAGEEKLGVLIPENGALVLDAKVAAKRIKSGCAFTLGECRENFFPIRPGENFPYLDKLRYGHLGFRDGIHGLII